MNLLRNLARNEGKAILVSTHELDLALQTADLIWLAGTQKKILTGIPEDLVLNGSFDEIFKFKGYDLKTGKVFHECFRKLSIQLNGEGYEYLWTKNALERTGYTVADAPNTALRVHVSKTGNQLQWAFQEKTYHSLNELLGHLGTISP
jgi:iron complex transport system ATP-binding protein